MSLEDIIKKFNLKRVNPFQGLVIDADAWRVAHSYHRDQQKLHLLAFHETGIAQGLKVTASRPPDLSVNIHPGIAVDPEGNIIAVPQMQRYQLQTRKPGTVYLIIQFREVPEGPYQPPEGGQPTRLLDAYKIEERDKLPTEPYIELARIDFNPTYAAVRDARASSRPGENEINLSFRHEAKSVAAPITAEKPTFAAPEIAVAQRETVTVGHAVLGGASVNLHSAGLKSLLREIDQRYDFIVKLEENVALGKNLGQYNVLYLTGNRRFELTAEQQAALNDFLQSGGTILGDGCFEGHGETEARGAKEFGLAFNQLAVQLKCKLEIVQRGHPLLLALHVFSDVPPGAEPGMLLEGRRTVYSGSDYGCAWYGGHQGAPLSREIIRTAFEMGANILAYARRG